MTEQSRAMKISPESISVENPQLWWPNGYGEQPLYTVRVELKVENTVVDVWENGSVCVP